MSTFFRVEKSGKVHMMSALSAFEQRGEKKTVVELRAKNCGQSQKELGIASGMTDDLPDGPRDPLHVTPCPCVINPLPLSVGWI